VQHGRAGGLARECASKRGSGIKIEVI
jgi:hypothetical protein